MPRQQKLAYEWSPTELMDAFWKALAKAAIHGSGLIISCSPNYEHGEAVYLRGVILSRLEGAERPFSRDDIVKLRADAPSRLTSTNSIDHGRQDHCFGTMPLEVKRVFYEGEGKWSLYLKFEGGDGFRYPADKFEKFPQEALQSA